MIQVIINKIFFFKKTKAKLAVKCMIANKTLDEFDGLEKLVS